MVKMMGRASMGSSWSEKNYHITHNYITDSEQRVKQAYTTEREERVMDRAMHFHYVS